MAGSVIGSVASGIIGGIGSKKSEKQFQAGANAAQQIFTPQPFQGRSLFTRTNAQGQPTFSTFGRNRFRETNNIAFSKSRSALNGFDRRGFAEKLLEASNRVNNKREAEAFAGLESKLFNRAGASTGTARQIADFGADLEDRRFRRGLDAQIAADSVFRGRLGDFTTALSALGGFESMFSNAQAQSLAGARALAPFAINNPAQGQVGAFRAQNTQNFFDGLGGLVGGGIDAGLSFLGSNSGGGGGGGFFNPGAIDFGGNPFVLS